jgi:hypothetical protein
MANHENFLSPNRRTLLKSGALAMMGGLISRSSGQTSQQWETSAPVHNFVALHKGQIGFQLAHEQFRVPELVELGAAAEKAGFDLLAHSDHFQPWQANEGRSGLAWVTMSAIGQRTHRVWMGTTVTCPAATSFAKGNSAAALSASICDCASARVAIRRNHLSLKYGMRP